MAPKLHLTDYAIADLQHRWEYLEDVAGPEIADSDHFKIIDFCQTLLSTAKSRPERGDIAPGCRLAFHDKRIAVAYRVIGDNVEVVGVYSSRQDYEIRLRNPSRWSKG
ncbi:type II toxin-antitoxin system RelE/ParE family toxin [Nesterenkonia muleiensis]|uniref:type II toxin-antitoxin system RelE/ParE family toxin n=1 Tax=Nesterenkonia muleiensis TaxID=2282648 RepID=UPI003B75C922